MGRMKELAMQLREQEMREPIPGVDFPIEDPEDHYWAERMREHEEFMMDAEMSGYPRHMIDKYGEPEMSFYIDNNDELVDELPWTCQVCNDPVAPGNEYCGQECAKVYHERKENEREDLPF